MPIPLSLIAAWGQCVCDPSTPPATKLVLGAILACAHSSIRFGDAQRVRWGSLQLSSQGLHAAAYATKTTKAGQPFACTWHGLSGRNAQTSWLLQWLALGAPHGRARLPLSAPRFAVLSRRVSCTGKLCSHPALPPLGRTVLHDFRLISPHCFRGQRPYTA